MHQRSYGSEREQCWSTIDKSLLCSSAMGTVWVAGELHIKIALKGVDATVLKSNHRSSRAMFACFNILGCGEGGLDEFYIHIKIHFSNKSKECM